ncbi:LOW QUALITY PROTEIN: hypothetical protein ACHAWO_004952 [Cyclotella atomus]|uniref:Secreted protein n=1 Tax=Cyclotella atomus TaxID=382360 RepID=A0ABD3NBG2_9STRA
MKCWSFFTLIQMLTMHLLSRISWGRLSLVLALKDVQEGNRSQNLWLRPWHVLTGGDYCFGNRYPTHSRLEINGPTAPDFIKHFIELLPTGFDEEVASSLHDLACE